MDQNGLNWSQVDLLQSPEKTKMDQNILKWIKMDQNGSKWIELDFSVIGNHMADSLKIILSIIILSVTVIEIDQNGLKWIKMD
jgi:hypothetical protein